MPSPYRLLCLSDFLKPPRAGFGLVLLLMLAAAPAAPAATAQAPEGGGGLYVKMRAGISDYLGDNNAMPFAAAAFSVEDKLPYSVGAELGYAVSSRWSVGAGIQRANYPIITRFYDHLDVTDHPTTRSTYHLLLRYVWPAGSVRPYVHFGYHLTFGTVNIFEASRLESGEALNTPRHYMHGPLLGAGLAYALAPRLSVFAEATAHASLMDDSVDGRLPLGPPQPTNLREVNRFGTFDLLNAIGIGLSYRPACGAPCTRKVRPRQARPPEERGVRMLRLSRAMRADVLMLSYQYAPPRFRRLFLGAEGGLVPRSIFVRYSFPDGQESLDETLFTSAYLGVAGRFFPLPDTWRRLRPHAGFSAGLPRQAHLLAGLDVVLGHALSVGVEGRYVACPTRRQVFRKSIDYEMDRVCEYGTNVALVAALRL